MPRPGTPRRDPPALLAGREVVWGGSRPAVAHAARLLGHLGATGTARRDLDGLGLGDLVVVAGAEDPAADWAASGAMALTGEPGGPPLVAPGFPATAARAAALATEALTATHPNLDTVALDGALLLGERAALAGLARQGSTSAGGSCRLLDAADAVVAVNLARSDDLTLLPAWLGSEHDAHGDWHRDGHDDGPASERTWEAVAAACARAPAAQLVERAGLLGLAVTLVPQPGEVADDDQSRHDGHGFPPPPWVLTDLTDLTHRNGAANREARPHIRTPGLVVDLSAMWAGPLCAHLLGLAGFEVVKVETLTRPDGARRGPPAFFDLLHHGHASLLVDLHEPTDRERLARLLSRADIVVESSRPRALDPLGLGPAAIRARSPGVVWVSSTGYGRSGPWANRVAFGDDAAAAAGLVATGIGAGTVFCGDAIADPLTGLHAALAALALWTAGRGGLVDVALRRVVSSTLAGCPCRQAPAPAARRAARGPAGGPAGEPSGGSSEDPGGAWVLDTAGGTVPVAPPVARARPSPVGYTLLPLGEDFRL